MFHDDMLLPTNGAPAIGPIMGLRRPKYNILKDALGPWLNDQPNDMIYIYIDIMSIVRHLFNEYALSTLVSAELNRCPKALAADLINLAGHYRNYIWKYHTRQTTVVMYYSDVPCAKKIQISSSFKEDVYSKMIGWPSQDILYTAIAKYVSYNLRIASTVSQYIPDIYFVNTKKLDPQVLPWIELVERNVSPMLIISNWFADLQYAALDGIAVLRPNGDHTRVVSQNSVISEAVRESKSKNKEDVVKHLKPAHIKPIIAMAGDGKANVKGIPNIAEIKAAKIIQQQIEKGYFDEDGICLETVLTGSKLPVTLLTESWLLLINDKVVINYTPIELEDIFDQYINKSSMGELERVNSQFFNSTPLQFNFLFAGITGY